MFDSNEHGSRFSWGERGPRTLTDVFYNWVSRGSAAIIETSEVITCGLSYSFPVKAADNFGIHSLIETCGIGTVACWIGACRIGACWIGA
jgi:hypothetical protein